MTREEAVKNIKEHCYFANLNPSAKEALDMAIKALEQEPCGDMISRQAAIDAICALCNTGETLEENPWRDNPHIDAIIDAFDNLPPVTSRLCDDAISRQSVLEVQAKYAEHIGATKFWQMRDDIKGLPSVTSQPCEDAISRAEVIDELNRIGRNAFKEDTDYDNFFAFLDSLPPVQPQPKVGHWIEYGHNISDSYIWDGVRCSVCKKDARVKTRFIKREPVIWDRDCFELTSYCPNCGAKMLPTDSEKE